MDNNEEKYKHLKTEFPGEFRFFFDTDGNLNKLGEIAEELYRLRRIPKRSKSKEGKPEKMLDCIGVEGCKVSFPINRYYSG